MTLYKEGRGPDEYEPVEDDEIVEAAKAIVHRRIESEWPGFGVRSAEAGPHISPARALRPSASGVARTETMMQADTPRLNGGAIAAKILVAPSGCWIWMGNLNDQGYARWGKEYVHRLVFEMLVGPMPDEMEWGHLCWRTYCVHPFHGRPVTHRDNMLEGDRNRAAINARRQECENGHEFIDETTYRDKRGHRHCRPCRTERMRKYRRLDPRRWR